MREREGERVNQRVMGKRERERGREDAVHYEKGAYKA